MTFEKGPGQGGRQLGLPSYGRGPEVPVDQPGESRPKSGHGQKLAPNRGRRQHGESQRGTNPKEKILQMAQEEQARHSGRGKPPRDQSARAIAVRQLGHLGE